MTAKVISVDDQIKLLLDENHKEPCEPSPEVEASLPPWYDAEKYKRGQKYIQDNIFAQFTIILSGVIGLFAIKSVLNILANTNKSSNTETAYKRYVSTIFHVYSWFRDDLRPGTESWRSLHAVRTRHFRASKSSKLRGGFQISHRDMVLTQFIFFSAGLLTPEKVGMRCDDRDDVEAYVHFWRTIGYMLGISEKYNLCRESLVETKKVCDAVRREIFCQHLMNPPEYFYHMSFAVLRAMWYFNVTVSEGSYMYFTMWLFGVEGYEYSDSKKRFFLTLPIDSKKNGKREEIRKELGWYNRITLRIIQSGADLAKTKFGRILLNTQVNVTLFLVRYFPIMSFWHFGLREAYVNMFKEDVAVPTKLMTNVEIFSTTDF